MKQNILVVSESLGQPNHKRGIFHFTRELVRSLASEGHELTLLVETSKRYRKLCRRERRTKLFPAQSRNIELLALYRFLDEVNVSGPLRIVALLTVTAMFAVCVSIVVPARREIVSVFALELPKVRGPPLTKLASFKTTLPFNPLAPDPRVTLPLNVTVLVVGV